MIYRRSPPGKAMWLKYGKLQLTMKAKQNTLSNDDKEDSDQLLVINAAVSNTEDILELDPYTRVDPLSLTVIFYGSWQKWRHTLQLTY